ncbi:unnamed protein product [Amoebophrya sp. A25]|nr:unnamed protein product [Amoebophrya sp. A25]|eukprot:GSA25T00001583001.1
MAPDDHVGGQFSGDAPSQHNSVAPVGGEPPAAALSSSEQRRASFFFQKRFYCERCLDQSRMSLHYLDPPRLPRFWNLDAPGGATLSGPGRAVRNALERRTLCNVGGFLASGPSGRRGIAGDDPRNMDDQNRAEDEKAMSSNLVAGSVDHVHMIGPASIPRPSGNGNTTGAGQHTNQKVSGTNGNGAGKKATGSGPNGSGSSGATIKAFGMDPFSEAEASWRTPVRGKQAAQDDGLSDSRWIHPHPGASSKRNMPRSSGFVSPNINTTFNKNLPKSLLYPEGEETAPRSRLLKMDRDTGRGFVCFACEMRAQSLMSQYLLPKPNAGSPGRGADLAV